MRWLAIFSVRNPVVVNLFVFTVVAAGFVFGGSLRREFFPEVRPNQVMVIAPYPGASPDQIEQTLARKIEDSLLDLNEVKEITTTATEGMATVVLEFREGTLTIDEAVARVKRRVDAIQDLPPQSERIVVRELEPNLPTISLSIYGDIDERLAKEEARRIRDDLRSLPGMGSIAISGARRDEISVEVDPTALLEHGLSLTAVVEAVRVAMADIPGGAVKTPTANISVRTLPIEERAAAVRQINLRGEAPRPGETPTGDVLRLEEIADVRLAFEDSDIRTRLNGKPTVSLTVFKVGKQDALLIAAMVRAYAAGRMGEPLPLTWRERLGSMLSGGAPPQNDRMAAYQLGLLRSGAPPGGAGGRIALHTDLSRFISGRLDLLTRNALQGGVLVFIMLLLFLNLRVALWVTAGLIVALLGTLATMNLTGITLNLLTMFGLIIVIGILVDDAIVVAENILARHEAGEPALSAAVNGTQEVGWPVVATVVTTIIAFGALLLIRGRMGDLLAALPMVVAVALGVSLIEALFILPSHMAHSLKGAENAPTRHGRVSRLRRFEHAMHRTQQRVIQGWLAPKYLRLLKPALRYRYVTLAIALGIFIVSVGMAASGRPKFDFLGTNDSETLIGNLRMPVGTPMEETDRILRRLEAAALAQPEVTTALAVVGAQNNSDGTEQLSQAHVAQMYIELTPAEMRDRTSDELIVAIRQAAGDLTGIKSLRLDALQGGPEGPPLSLTVSGDDPARIIAVVEKLKTAMAAFEGVYDVADDADRGQRELRIELLPGARELGFTTQNLAMQIRAAVLGIEAHTFAIPGEDVDVRVRLIEPSRRSLSAIENMHVFTPTGVAVPLAEVAEVYEAESYATVRRVDRRRAVTITAEVDKQVVSPEAVATELAQTIRTLLRDNPGIFITPRGRQEQVRDSLSSLPLGMLAAVTMIYVCLAWLFRSYMMPAVILCAVPFAVVGMVWGHLLLGFDMTILSLIGFVALSGVVVNDAIVFSEFYMKKRRLGATVTEAALETGRQRLRAILLTTITTIGGLSPLMMEQSFQARFLIPMAITISFGLMSATFIILLLLPALLLIGHDIRAIAYYAWRGERLPEREFAVIETLHEHAPMHPTDDPYSPARPG
ncbi:MAG: efflux RND transporter permease subunit [Phycisphaeraceae bacterium]|nr:efflux RND transporter permease subunit [Phycisphaeraceae bacterium]MCW5753153.1 efflux RND transporter permease subunit [Phycisphaeraceae bacterium]